MNIDEDAVIAAVDLIGRSGGTDFELGYLHDDVPVNEASWWAKANYRGTRIFVEDRQGPDEAADALARQVLDGGTCTHCFKETVIKGNNDARHCRWYRSGNRWVRGCEK